MDLLSSGDVALMMEKVPCEFQADRKNFIFQLVAPDVIWHIYSHLYHSSRDVGRDLPSSGEASLTSTAQSKCAKSYQELPADK